MNTWCVKRVKIVSTFDKVAKRKVSTREYETVKTGLTFAEAKAMRRSDKTLEIVKE
jgi:hypothetical protein